VCRVISRLPCKKGPEGGLREFSVEFLPSGRTIRVPAEKRLADAAQEAGLPLASRCGGEGTCGRCLVRLIRCHTDPTAREAYILAAGKLARGFRLGCQVRVASPLRVLVPVQSLASQEEEPPGGAEKR